MHSNDVAMAFQHGHARVLPHYPNTLSVTYSVSSYSHKKHISTTSSPLV